MPCRIDFADGNSISYLYDANGKKLRTTHIIGNDTTLTDYCGNVTYENGVAKTLLVEGGYVLLSDNKYHFYFQDHQGNNRVVADENGNIEEVNHYYPFGGTFASSSSSVPAYKYNGKELDKKNGLDWYDYGARHYDVLYSKGILSGTEMKNMSSKQITGVMQSQEGRTTGKTIKSHVYEVKSDNESLSIMNFLDKNTDVEWSNTLMNDNQGNSVNLITTSHENSTVGLGSYQIGKYTRLGFQVIRADHIHPGIGRNTPSGLIKNLNGANGGDIGNAKNILEDSPKAIFRILNKGKYYDYTNKVRK